MDKKLEFDFFLLGYLLIFFAFLILSKNFRERLIDWFTLKDGFGVQFWANNVAFLVISVAYWAAGVFLIG